MDIIFNISKLYLKLTRVISTSEIVAYVRSNLSHLIYLKHLIRSRAVTNLIVSFRKHLFFFMRALMF